MSYYHAEHTAQEIKDRIGWMEGTDVREEVMALCNVVAQLQAQLDLITHAEASKEMRE